MSIFIQVLLILCLTVIVYQDNKERAVLWYLFPLAAVLFSCLHILEVGVQNFIINSGINLLFILIIVGILTIYVKLKSGNFNILQSIGLGDILFFVALAFSFASFAFVTLLVCGLIFSLILHSMLSRKRKKEEKTVPLAGHLSLFFGGILIAYWLGLYNTLYLL